MDFIKKVLQDLPPIHSGETEVLSGYVASKKSVFSKKLQAKLENQEDFCWALGESVLRYIDKNVYEGAHTLEIGSGVSTFVFAKNKAKHICITPSSTEIERIKNYALNQNLGLDNVTFINDYSEFALPKLNPKDLFDLILIDGKHAFPWPFLDWFYSVIHLKKGGILIVDDTHLTTGRLLSDFMKKDPTWEYLEMLDQKTCIFRKMTDDIRNIAWHMQPFITSEYKENYFKKLKGFLKRMLNN
jgi:predicted O-methyltransferase YrrM